MERHLRGLLIFPDEKVAEKGRHCMTLRYHLEETFAEYIGESRQEASLAGFFAAFPIKHGRYPATATHTKAG